MSDVVVDATAPSPSPAPAPGPAPSPSPAPGPAPGPAPDTAKGYWPDDWRKTVSKDDAKSLARLERYGSPEEVAKALFAAQNKISSGELRPTLPKDAKPEEIAEYRKALGIPETPDKYDLKDVKVDEKDKAFVAEVMKAAHETHQTPDQVAATIKTWNTIKTMAAEARVESDKLAQTKASDALHVEWGADYRRNMNLIQGLLDGSGDAKTQEKFLKGYMADGTPYGSSPEVLKMLLGVALAANPTGTLVPGGSADPQGGVKEELEKITKVRNTDRAAYNKDEAMQAKERELIGMAQKQGWMDEQGNWKK